MYQYVPVHTILPDPVQVYRIPDAPDSSRKGVVLATFDGCEEVSQQNFFEVLI